LQRAGAALLAASCADAGNASILVACGVLPQLVALMDSIDGGMVAAARAAIEALCLAVPAALFWSRGALPLTVKTADGFYAVTRDSELLAVADLAKSNLGPEVLLVDSAVDAGLADVIAAATELTASDETYGEPSMADAAAMIARLVCERMGGAVNYHAYEQYTEPAARVSIVREQSGSRVVLLGALSAGATRHRALLYKVLCDHLGIMCSYDAGTCLRGAHAYHAWNTLILNGEVVVVDVTHNPGAFYPEASDEARQYKRIDEYAFSSLQSTFIKRTVPLAPGLVDATSAKQHGNELFPTGAAPF